MIPRVRTPLSVVLGTCLVIAVAWSVILTWPVSARDADQPWDAPEFTHSDERDWINTGPLTIEGLKGNVILVDFWAFGCWNCYRSFPWLNDLEARYQLHDLIIVGVHSPEFEHEKNRDEVIKKVSEFELGHPVMIDNDFSYWKAMANRYWPTFYLIDKAGRVRASFIGETHRGDANARAIEKKIVELLNESQHS